MAFDSASSVCYRYYFFSISFFFFLGSKISPDREEDWAGLHLSHEETLSAHELHERFTEESSDPKTRLTRLMVLCASYYGKRPRMLWRSVPQSSGLVE